MKPETTYQVYNTEENILTVYNGADETTGIYFHGDPADYDGTATEPAAPTSQYEDKQRELSLAGYRNMSTTPNALPDGDSASTAESTPVESAMGSEEISPAAEQEVVSGESTDSIAAEEE